MPVNSVNRVPAFHIDPSSESNDEERRREKQQQNETSKKRRPSSEDASSSSTNSSGNLSSQANENDLASQVVDTEKVIELMRHKPHDSITPRLLAKRLNSAPAAAVGDKKRINKAY